MFLLCPAWVHCSDVTLPGPVIIIMASYQSSVSILLMTSVVSQHPPHDISPPHDLMTLNQVRAWRSYLAHHNHNDAAAGRLEINFRYLLRAAGTRWGVVKSIRSNDIAGIRIKWWIFTETCLFVCVSLALLARCRTCIWYFHKRSFDALINYFSFFLVFNFQSLDII